MQTIPELQALPQTTENVQGMRSLDAILHDVTLPDTVRDEYATCDVVFDALVGRA